MMGKKSLMIMFVVGLLLVGCQNVDNASNKEVDGPPNPTPTRLTYTLWELAHKAEIIANLTVTELVEELEVGDEYTTFKYSIFKATVNNYYYDGLGYGDEIEVLHGGGPTGEFADDPLLQIGDTYILFLDEREDQEMGSRLVMTGGPSGRFNKVDDDHYVRQVNPPNSSGSNSVTEAELMERLNRHNEDLNIKLDSSEE